MRRQPLTWILSCAVLLWAPPVGAQLTGGWAVERSEAADLWFHTLAVLGFGEAPGLRLYSESYREDVRRAKEELGVFPTSLDKSMGDLRDDLADDPAFQIFHFVPLYFPGAQRGEFLRALQAVAERKTRDPDLVTRATRPGVAVVARAIRDGGQRKVLRRMVKLLEAEWDEFFGRYVERNAATWDQRVAEVATQWSEEFEPALQGFLASQRLDRGTVLVSPALGAEGRLYEGVPASRSDNVVAVWLPTLFDQEAAISFSILKEMCFAAVEDAMRAPGVRGGSAQSSNGAVRCGAVVLESYLEEQADGYRDMFLELAVGQSDDAPDSFAVAYPIDDGLERAMERLVRPATAARAGTGQSRRSNFGWVFRPSPQADLWFHALAVLAADQPGPLGLYSADYATYIRELKRERGVYPTTLDSIGADIREKLDQGDGSLLSLHFVPLYFHKLQPEEMLDALEAVANRRTEEVQVSGPEAQFGLLVLSQQLTSGSDRRLLRKIVEAAREEWEVFFKDFWDEWYEDQREQYDAIQELWDEEIGSLLIPYLERRRLSGGLVMPSPALGPEGRITEQDPFDPADQVVAVQFPVSIESPDAATFAFIKELCFLDQIVPPDVTRGFTSDPDAAEDLRRRVAVRCGAMLLEFYAPILAIRYRRAFLDAVGAEESTTQAAFERVYYVDQEIIERLREQIRRGR